VKVRSVASGAAPTGGCRKYAPGGAGFLMEKRFLAIIYIGEMSRGCSRYVKLNPVVE